MVEQPRPLKAELVVEEKVTVTRLLPRVSKSTSCVGDNVLELRVVVPLTESRSCHNLGQVGHSGVELTRHEVLVLMLTGPWDGLYIATVQVRPEGGVEALLAIQVLVPQAQLTELPAAGKLGKGEGLEVVGLQKAVEEG